MKRILLLFLGLIFLVGCNTMQTTVKPPENVNVPKKVKFLAQSCTENALFQSLIDLSNNELVVLEYMSGVLYRIYRTGIFLNPADYAVHSGIDAPFQDRAARTDDTNNASSGNKG